MASLTRASLPAAQEHPELQTVLSKVCPEWELTDDDFDLFFGMEANYRLEPLGPGREEAFSQMCESLHFLDAYLFKYFDNYTEEVRMKYNRVNQMILRSQINHNRGTNLEVGTHVLENIPRGGVAANETVAPSMRFQAGNALSYLLRYVIPMFNSTDKIILQVKHVVQMWIYDSIQGKFPNGLAILHQQLQAAKPSRCPIDDEWLTNVHFFVSTLVKIEAMVNAGILDSLRLNVYGLADEHKAEGEVLKRAYADINTIAENFLQSKHPKIRMNNSAYWPLQHQERLQS